MSYSDDIIATVFAHVLKLSNVNAIAISKRVFAGVPQAYKQRGEGILHYLVNALILNKVRICSKSVRGVPLGFHKGVSVLSPVRGGYVSDAIAVKLDEDCETDITNDVMHRLVLAIPKTPTFIIDLSLWELHHEKEKSSLILQLVMAINTVRRWLTDFHLILSSAPSEVLNRLKTFTPIAIGFYTTNEIYSMLNPSKTLVLDPYASDSLTDRDVLQYDFYIIGGITDRLYPRPYATYMLYRMHHLNVPRKSIKLGGSAIGVPNEVNKIIDVILSARLGGLPLDKAIIKNMGVDDKIARILYEVRKSFKDRKDRDVDIDELKKLIDVYGLNERYLAKVLAKIKSFK